MEIKKTSFIIIAFIIFKFLEAWSRECATQKLKIEFNLKIYKLTSNYTKK